MGKVSARFAREFQIPVSDSGGAPIVGIGIVACCFFEIRQLYFFGDGRGVSPSVTFGRILLTSHVEGCVTAPRA